MKFSVILLFGINSLSAPLLYTHWATFKVFGKKKKDRNIKCRIDAIRKGIH